MPVELTPPHHLRERTLLIGGMGTGKSSAICSMMAKLPSRHFHIIDTDEAFEFNLLGWPDVVERANYTIYPASNYDWPTIPTALEEASAACGGDDFFVFDCSSESWGAIQGYARANDWWRLDKNGKKIKDDIEWVTVNSEYQRVYKAIMQCKGNVVVTADVDALGDRDEKQMRVVFGPWGLKPKGQKTLWRYFHSIVLMRRSKGDVWTATGIRERDRSRELLDDVEIVDGNFVSAYLMKCAGWKMRKVD